MIVVGGANSAGQAAVFLVQTARTVHLVVRASGLSGTMSRDLVRRIEESPNVVLHTRTEIEAPYLLETTLAGVFAVGDVWGGSVKRVASAVGEGSIAISFVHRVLQE